MDDHNAKGMCEVTQQIRRSAEELERKAGGVQGVVRNVERILTSAKMLELNMA
ncbi:hypothetical protein M1N79_03960 [Dehalococcoidia bacterium]|nr:hypothetical protein [Dehalococcoidia bacterium]